MAREKGTGWKTGELGEDGRPVYNWTRSERASTATLDGNPSSARNDFYQESSGTLSEDEAVEFIEDRVLETMEEFWDNNDIDELADDYANQYIQDDDDDKWDAYRSRVRAAMEDRDIPNEVAVDYSSDFDNGVPAGFQDEFSFNAEDAHAYMDGIAESISRRFMK